MQLFETVVFFCIGASTALYLRHMHVGFTCAVTVGCMIGRFASVCGLSVPLNMHAERKSRSAGGVATVLSKSQQMVLWCGGLRGAVAFALVLSFPSSWRSTLIGTVAWIVFATTLVGGAGTPLLLDYLGMAHNGVGDGDAAADHTQLEESFGDGGLEALGSGSAGNAAGELPQTAGAFTRKFRKLELKLLATGSTEAARAAARLAENSPAREGATTTAEQPTSPHVARPHGPPPPSHSHGENAVVANETLGQNSSTQIPASQIQQDQHGFTDVPIDQPTDPQNGRVSPPRSTPHSLPAHRARARSGPGSAADGSDYDPGALTQTASVAQRQNKYSDDVGEVRP